MRIPLLLVALLGLIASGLSAQETGHYPAGAEGIKGATVPGPGDYLKWYNFYYQAETLKDGNGNRVPTPFNVNVFATAPRFIHITETEILGANYGWDVLVPLLHTDIEAPGLSLNRSRTAVGDIYVEPLLLGWHGDQYDLGAAIGIWCPTGDYNPNSPANAGKDYWTGMFTLGTTLYLDEAKTWSVSTLGRYETNSSHLQFDRRAGDNFHIEWGIGKTIEKVWDVGVSGYCYWQVTDDRGAAITYDPTVHDRLFSIGPEVQYFHEPTNMAFQLRYQWDFAARDRLEGQNLVLSVVKILGE